MKSRLANILLLLVVTVATLALADVAFRFYESRALTASYKPDGPVVDLQALNYNDTSVAKAKAPGELRILSFGDSFCFSIVRFPASYNGIIQRDLTRPDRPARVVNLGEPSSSFLQYAASMLNWMPQLEHDAVIVNIFLGNDLSESAREEIPNDGRINRMMGNNFVDVQSGRKRMRHVPRKFPLRMLDFAYAYVMYYVQGASVDHTVPEPYTFALGPMPEPNWLRISSRHLEGCDPTALPLLEKASRDVAILGKILSDVQAQGKRVLVVFSPAEVQVNPGLLAKAAARLERDPASFDVEQPARLLRKWLGESAPNVPILDLQPVIRDAFDKGVKVYYPLETHWSAEGNRIAGDTISAWITANWPEMR